MKKKKFIRRICLLVSEDQYQSIESDLISENLSLGEWIRRAADLYISKNLPKGK